MAPLLPGDGDHLAGDRAFLADADVTLAQKFRLKDKRQTLTDWWRPFGL